MAKRFRVALSFPGGHRPRVKEIAEALGEKLGRDKVLYDKWYGAEFNRINLNLYLSALYHDQSDLIAVFVCKEYNEKEWCGLEWRACLDLIKRRSGVRMMFFRLDDADIPGLYSTDGYQDIRDMSTGEVTAAILSQLQAPETTPVYRSSTAKLPIVNPTLIGREKELAFLDRAWADPNTNFVQIFAAGGTGKTALVNKWFRAHLAEATVFGWSFYSQGTSEDRQTSTDPFFAEILSWFQIDLAPTASIYNKAEAIARRLRSERVLLILDGVEPLQEPTGALRDAALKALLQELDTGHRGLVVCSTRIRLDIPDDAPRALSLDLDNLTPQQGAQYLRSLKVEGSDEELQQASREYWNHALALTLLGTYLVDFCASDIRRRKEIPELLGGDANAHRVIAAYERMFAGRPELDILRAVGYFDRPAEPAALKLVLPPMEDHNYRAALNRLHAARLVLTRNPSQPLDCHPLVREHFAKAATAEGHARLYEYYQKQAAPRPDTLEEMTPLFYAVYHGCRAGQHVNCCNDVYYDRIQRGADFCLTRKLGAFGTDLSLLANFFEAPWTHPAAAISPSDQTWLINEAGFSLRAVGRLSDAVEPTRAAAEAYVKQENWRNAARAHTNLSQLLLTIGNIAEAIAAAAQAIELADRSGNAFERTVQRTTLADALHQSGNLARAKSVFEEAERLQAQAEPTSPILYSVPGYECCDLLLSQGKAAEVLRRATETLAIARGNSWIRTIGLDHLSLGRAHPPGSAEAADHLNQAVEFLRRAGNLNYLPRALLARGTSNDLDEVFRIASRSGMRLHLADYHLAKGNLPDAERIIQETGYHRRDAELASLRARMAGA